MAERCLRRRGLINRPAVGEGLAVWARCLKRSTISRCWRRQFLPVNGDCRSCAGQTEARTFRMLTKTFITGLVCCLALVLIQPAALAGEHEFKYKAPDAQSVELMCEFNGWKGVPMTKGDDGVWSTKVTLSSSTYAYKFLVDGKDWKLDPDNSNKKTVDNIENSSIEIK
jgi:hypothetical protein